MFGFQTVSCLHNIPVVRSSTNKIQDVYAKAKDSSILIRLPCQLAETVADTSMKIAVTVADPFVKPFRGPVRLIDDFAAGKIRQIGTKFPVINTSTDKVMNTVKDTTSSKIQQGKETVSHVATATVNKATDVADSVYTFCETHVPGKTVAASRHDFGRRTTLLWERIRSTVRMLRDYSLQSIYRSFVWVRMLMVFFLLRLKKTNDGILREMQRQPFFTALPQRLLIKTGAILESLMALIRPDDRTITELNKAEKLARPNQLKRPQTPQYVSRQTLKPDAFITTRQSVVVTNQSSSVTRPTVSKPQTDYSVMANRETLYPRLPTDDVQQSSTSHIEPAHNDDVEKLHNKLNATDIELLYTRLPADVIFNDGLVTDESEMLHGKIFGGAEFERQGDYRNGNY